jgi:hypothetical protein
LEKKDEQIIRESKKVQPTFLRRVVCILAKKQRCQWRLIQDSRQRARAGDSEGRLNHSEKEGGKEKTGSKTREKERQRKRHDAATRKRDREEN